MALSWKVSKVENWEHVCYTSEGDLSAATEGLLWATMAIGLPEITSKNWCEFWARGVCLELWNGMTPTDVYKHIGLCTNASPITKAKFKTHMYDYVVKREISKAKAEVMG